MGLTSERSPSSEPRWPNTSEGVGFIPRSQPETRNDAAEFETALTQLVDAQRKTLDAARLKDV
jgi:hypothetical protein